ncbi:stalk domain-containing protein [Paenibacillus koleovorans]|uniref:stalk domain-containing protein n=1 Tax=Paenibacillus koleovorans TaxID=121608 RepID=UPI001FED295A|nr:stalk domain-containing protein [Paenibacillus koleovorans]
MNKRKWMRVAPWLLVAVLLLGYVAEPRANAGVSSTTMSIVLKENEQVATVDGQKYNLNTPGAMKDGSDWYVPVKFLADHMGFEFKTNDKTKKLEIGTATTKIEIDTVGKTVLVNGKAILYASAVRLYKDNLMMNYMWLNDYLGAKYSYNTANKQIEVTYVKRPQTLTNDPGSNSKPVARFTFGKEVYRIGEEIKYIDLSYDPDAEGLNHIWTGKAEAFYKPGKYLVSLKVTDGSGKMSDTYSRYVEVENRTLFATDLQRKLYTAPLNSFIRADWPTLYAHFLELPELTKKVTEDKSRTMLVSNSPETITEKGILYQDKINGKGRLYAAHMNGMKEKMQFVIMATNPGKTPVTIRTTNKGEVYPSIYAHLIGHEASVEFLLKDKYDEKLTIPPGATRTYVQMPDFWPGQGVNVIYDVETDGEIQFSFMAMDSVIETPTSLYPTLYYPLPSDGHVRGTFPMSEKRWDVDGSHFSKPSRLVFGDNISDPFQPGYDVFLKKNVQEDGNYGVNYHIRIEKPRKMVVLLIARGGAFKGPFKFNGEFVMAPPSGVVVAFEQIQIMHRTTGEEPYLDIEFTPPAGSAFPMDLIFYPLDDIK